MDFPKIKELKKLAEACRKAGISSFKYNTDKSFEFSLDPSFQKVQKNKSKKSTTSEEAKSQTDTFESDSLSEEQLLMWSVGGLPTTVMGDGSGGESQ